MSTFDVLIRTKFKSHLEDKRVKPKGTLTDEEASLTLPSVRFRDRLRTCKLCWTFDSLTALRAVCEAS